MPQQPLTLLCLASEFKGGPFLEEAKKLGCKVLLIVSEEAAGDDWPQESIDEFFPMPVLWQQPDITYGVSYLARSHKVDAIVALDDYDVETAANLREHLRLPGMGETQIRYFRDKLAMRLQADNAGIPVPPFTSIINYDNLREWMAKTPLPWMLKPRFEAGAVGIKKMEHSEQVWRALDELGDKQSYYLLEQFLPGQVYHVDSLMWDSEVVFSLASKYGLPPLTVSHGGGVFSSRTLPASDPETQIVTKLTRQLLTAFGMEAGVSHTEFIRDAAGNFNFLETAARVGGANLDKLVQAASGVNLWQEAARIVVAQLQDEAYAAPESTGGNAGILTSLARQQQPDLSTYNAPEVVWQLNMDYHAGLIVAAAAAARVEQLMAEYADRFAHDFMAKGKLKETMRQ